MSQDLITNLYNSFDPFQPLPAGDAAYVDLRSVRGDANILRDLGNKIIRSPGRNTCQLYAGHRGAGKSTELLRLQADLNLKGCFVVYFAADQDDLDPEDTEYTDILIACTRRLLEQLKNANPQPLLTWLSDRQQDLKELAFTEIRFDDLKLETAIGLFSKLSSNIRAIPTERAKIRAKLDPHTVTLLSALNQFIQDGKRHLPSDQSQLVVIVDNLDRIVPINREEKRTNHEEIFIDRANQLKGLDCHLIYTIPISMVYSSRVSDLRDIYDNDPLVLPMIMVEMPDNQTVCKEGMDQLKELIRRRVRKYAPTRPLETNIFESLEVLEKLCLMSGGHIRLFMKMIQKALDHTDNLPIAKKAVSRAIADARDEYLDAIYEHQWELLRAVDKSHQIPNEQNNREYQRLLASRCLLEYRYRDEDENLKRWYVVHPLIKEMEKFKG